MNVTKKDLAAALKLIKAQKAKEKTQPTFNVNLQGVKTFVNKIKHSRKIESIKANKETKIRNYVNKGGDKKVYTFKWATINYVDGGTENRFYHDLGYMIKREW